MRRWLAFLLTAVVVTFVLRLYGQAPEQKPLAFEVASIKLNTSGSQIASTRAQPGGRVTFTNVTLFMLIRNLYRLEDAQIVGGPDWLHTDRWDIVAKAPGDADQDTMIAMAKTLLADRFTLAVHDEARELPVYALVLARRDGRLGPLLHRSSTDCAALIAEARARGAMPPSRTASGAPVCGTNVSAGRLSSSARALSDLARVLTPLAGRTIIDKTGLAGVYDADLIWNDSEEGPSLFAAIQEQLGLKLEPTKALVDVLVIDHVEKPTSD
jgi:uncharacterized protein (TIGR03435 family)